MENAVKRLPLLVVAVLIIPACGKSHSGFKTIPPALQRPVAVVPEKMKVQVSAVPPVTLDGSKSYDPVPLAPPLTFLWTQTAGTPVVLSSTTASKPTFAAPAVPGDLTFQLTVTGVQGTDSASVTVSVKTFIVNVPNEPWFVGYGKTSQTLTPTVLGTTTAPTYLWTGIEPWLKVTTPLDALTLGYSVPTLTEFQNFPDRAGVLLMERTTQGRLQLKITVTDGGVSDEDFVNFSVGPFADSVANENVALGEPVFLNGGATIPLPQPAPPAPPVPPATITSWTWSGTKPNGTPITDFRKPDKSALSGATTEHFVYFVTDLPGTYQIQVRQNNPNPEAVSKFFEITCGSYVGVGNLTGTTPNPLIGECAACHAGQLAWVPDFANPWKETGHAKMLQSILDPASPFYTASQAKESWLDFFNFGSNFSIDSRTVGWSRISSKSNGGWAETAALEGCVLKGTSWDELVRKHPKTAAKSNVQCESCHGPGSEHAGDSSMIRKSYDANVCGRCHSDKQDLWEPSGHGQTTSDAFKSGSGSANCNGCHTAQGFIVEMRAQETADPHPVLFAVSNINRPVLPLDDRRSQSCQTCHEPHKKTVGRPAQPGPDPQLRAYGDVKFRNDVVAFAGEAAVCYMCHQSRTDTRVNSPDWNVRRAPHDSTAAEMLSATNGMEFAGWTYISSAHADKSRFVVFGKSEARQCLTCHVDVTPPKGQFGYNAIGGHTFKMSQGDGNPVFTAAAGTPGTTAGTRTFRFSQPTPISSFLKKVYTGDTLQLSGTDAGTYEIESVDGSQQVTVKTKAGFTTFAGGTPSDWSIISEPKFNTAACAQCHPPTVNFNYGARADYDGSGGAPTDVQGEIAGLRAALKTAIEAKVTAMVGPPATLVVANGRIRYTVPTGTRTFPGPGVTTGDNPEISYNTLSSADKATWDALYAAAYNWAFVGNDRSEGIHNTGYSVNLLQSAYKAVTGSTIGSPFTPF
jgi:hypothetical protein